MKIGINAVFRWQPTGVGSYICHLVRSLSEIDRQNEYYIFTQRAGDGHSTFRPDNFHFVACQAGAHSPAYRRLWEQLVLPRMAARYRLDVLHSPMNIAPIRLRCRSVVTIHDALHFVHPESVSFLRREYHRWLVRASFRRADVVITVSGAVEKELRRLLGRPKNAIRKVYHGVDRAFRLIDDAERFAEMKRCYGIEHKYVLFVGYPHSRKNLPRLVAAFARLVHRVPEAYVLVIAGDMGNIDSDLENIRRSVLELGLSGKVVFTGYVPAQTLPLLINGAEVMAFPSYYEGFGFPVVEAMACGTPVLAADIPVIREVAGGAAVLVNPYSVEDMAEGLCRLVAGETLRKGKVKAGLERARCFSWEETARLTLECYSEAARARGRGGARAHPAAQQ